MKDSMEAMSRIKKLTGTEFDRQFISMMITDHDKEVGRIDVDAAGAREPALADWLRSQKPVLQRHADAARELQRGQPTASSANPPSSSRNTGNSGNTGTSGNSGNTGTGGNSGTGGTRR